MKPAVRVTGAWIQLLLDWLKAERLPAPEIRAALASRAEDDVVPTAVWRQLVESAVELRPRAVAPGLAIGALVQPRHIGVLGYLVLASETVGEALRMYQRHERLLYGASLAEVEILGRDMEVRWPKAAAAGSLGQTCDAIAIAAFVTFMRRQSEDPRAPSMITFANTKPRDAAYYKTFFGCPVRFGDTHTRVRFPMTYLALPLPHGDPALRTLLGRQADALARAAPDSDELDRALQQMVLKVLPEGLATLPRVAKALHVSVRTLQRRFDARGLTWQTWLDRTREELALQYLSDHALSLSDVALLLGFSEQSAFSRAFRRWTGATPQQARPRKRA